MRIFEPAVAALIGAKHAAGQDLFLVPGEAFAPADALTLARTLGRNLLVFLPGAFYPDAAFAPLSFQRDGGGDFRFPPSPFAAFADVRLLTDEAFVSAMEAAETYEWILPFADCADPAEHGYRRSYGAFAELRAQSPGFCGITALFDEPPEAGRYQRHFGSGAYAVVGTPAVHPFPLMEAKDEADRLRLLLRYSTVRVQQRTAVVFPTRRQAEAFFRVASRQRPCALVHGGRSYAENANAVGEFRRGALTVLVATKHLLPSAPFLRADRVLYGGLPFSTALLFRLAALLPAGERPLCVTAPGDEVLNDRLALSCAEALSLPAAAFAARRKEKQLRAAARLER